MHAHRADRDCACDSSQAAAPNVCLEARNTIPVTQTNSPCPAPGAYTCAPCCGWCCCCHAPPMQRNKSAAASPPQESSRHDAHGPTCESGRSSSCSGRSASGTMAHAMPSSASQRCRHPTDPANALNSSTAVQVLPSCLKEKDLSVLLSTGQAYRRLKTAAGATATRPTVAVCCKVAGRLTVVGGRQG